MNRITKNPEERRNEIVEAAGKLFEEKGYEKTTMQDVMSHLGIAKGTVYHYFKSKEELLSAVVDHTIETFIEHLEKALKTAEGGAIENFQLLFKAGNVEESHSELLKELHSPANSALHTRQLATLVNQVAPLYAQVIEEGCNEGVFKTENPLECAELLLAGMQFLTDLGIYPWNAEEIKRRRKSLPSLAEALLNAPQGSLNFLS